MSGNAKMTPLLFFSLVTSIHIAEFGLARARAGRVGTCQYVCVAVTSVAREQRRGTFSDIHLFVLDYAFFIHRLSIDCCILD